MERRKTVHTSALLTCAHKILTMMLYHTLNNVLEDWKVCNSMCEEYIVDHLAIAREKCEGISCKLWKFCLDNGIYSVLKYADEGFVVHSKLRPTTVGKVSPNYLKYKQERNEIGHGGFGRVYKFTTDLAIKEEYKRPLFLNAAVFKQLIRCNNSKDDHVIPLLEYVVGGFCEDDPNKHVFLFVMPHMNRGGLPNLFKKQNCVIKYMVNYPILKKQCRIFSNYINMFIQVFKGLQYLHSNEIVHGDVKDTNILVHQTCSCTSPLLCACPGDLGVTYVLGDMDLLCIHGKHLSGKYVKWAKAKCCDPSGTPGMKATELYFTGMKREKCGSNATDVWACCVTMMKVLVGDVIVKEATKQIKEYFDAVSIQSSKHVFNIVEAHKIAHQLKHEIEVFDWSKGREMGQGYLKEKIMEKFDKMTHFLKSGELLKQAHWISSYTYPEKLPLPFILGAVHGANSLHH
ncbi:uncharacterized protein [Dysidea avara]|uniref:uncharacterized protein n=1 Tax=Dysidea avara TaxID=196820 RepID=UPI00332F5B80